MVSRDAEVNSHFQLGGWDSYYWNTFWNTFWKLRRMWHKNPPFPHPWWFFFVLVVRLLLHTDSLWQLDKNILLSRELRREWLSERANEWASVVGSLSLEPRHLFVPRLLRQMNFRFLFTSYSESKSKRPLEKNPTPFNYADWLSENAKVKKKSLKKSNGNISIIESWVLKQKENKTVWFDVGAWMSPGRIET